VQKTGGGERFENSGNRGGEKSGFDKELHNWKRGQRETGTRNHPKWTARVSFKRNTAGGTVWRGVKTVLRRKKKAKGKDPNGWVFTKGEEGSP